jgi:alpha-ketoglutarate-dependent taurine dioxygenase
MEEHGYVHLTGMPDDFDPVSFGRRLGPLMPHHNGALVAEVRPASSSDGVYYPGSTKAFAPHTEGYDLIGLPPRYLALWCVHPPSGDGGETTLADTRPWLARLSEQNFQYLEKTDYDWMNPHGDLGVASRHPVLADHHGSTVVRFSVNNIVHDDTDLVAALQSDWQRLFDEQHFAISYQRNDMLIWDNWRVLHARNAFADPRRHLRRIHIAEAD